MSLPIIDMYNRGEIDEVVLIYTSFISSMEQEVKNITLLPFEVEEDPDIMRNSKAGGIRAVCGGCLQLSGA